ncbi:MAG: hypothetical protein K0S47_1929 [Herbinix sp.]|nr:hypothetical protein [Herbinix sp.]
MVFDKGIRKTYNNGKYYFKKDVVRMEAGPSSSRIKIQNQIILTALTAGFDLYSRIDTVI